MAINDDNTPILIGGGQFIQRDVEPQEALGPLEMIEQAARRAAEDARIPASALSSLDSLTVMRILGGSHRDLPQQLAQRVGAHPAEARTSEVGGNTPQKYVNELAARIQRGEVQLALLGGGEALHTYRRARRAGVELGWDTSRDQLPDGEPPPTSELENRHQVMMPPIIYPLYENALRAHRGLDLDSHRLRMGERFSRFSAVAANNSYAWFPKAKSAEELVEVSPRNRMVSFPYTKYLNSILQVDLAAALLMTSVGKARQLGVPSDRWIYWLGGSDVVEEPWFFSERANFHSSPAMQRAMELGLAQAGLVADDLHFFDLYSCFPSAVEMACDSLGIEWDDPRPLTVTGGLPFAGGPGNAYCLHAIANMVDATRAAPGSVGLVSGLGWYFTKHSTGLYSSSPPLGARPAEPTTSPGAAPRVIENAEGSARVETYTLIYDREGRPSYGVVIGRLEDGARFIANTPRDPERIEDLASREAVGRTGHVSAQDGRNLFEPA